MFMYSCEKSTAARTTDGFTGAIGKWRSKNENDTESKDLSDVWSITKYYYRRVGMETGFSVDIRAVMSEKISL